MSGRKLTSLELVEAFERYPGIVPTWPRLIRERALAEAAPPPLDGLREALTKIANPDHRTPGAECLWCMDDLPEHEDWCAATIARVALREEGETT